jgi:Tfp pilus assembly protein PilF
LGDLGTAERHGRIALDIAGHLGRIDTPTMVGLAIVQTHLGRLGDAEQIYRTVLELEPSVAEWHFNLGGFLASQNRLAESVPFFEKCIELDPTFGEAYFRLGTIWIKLNEPGKAVSVWNQGLSQGDALSFESKESLQLQLSEYGNGDSHGD